MTKSELIRRLVATALAAVLLPAAAPCATLRARARSPQSAAAKDSPAPAKDSPRGRAVNVRDFARGGDGTPGSPWTGWDTAITWSPYTSYLFSDGWYAYTTSPQFGHDGISIVGGKNTFLKFTGSGVGFDFTARDTPPGYPYAFTQAARLENLRLVGNRNMSVGFDISGVSQSIFNDLRVKSVSSVAYRIRFAISDVFINCRFSQNEEGAEAGSPLPANGFLLDDRNGAAEPTQNSIFINPIAEGTTDYGIKLAGHSWLNTFVGGTSEGNGGGIFFSSSTRQNKIEGMDLESNKPAPDVLADGVGNLFSNLLGASNLVVNSTARNTHIEDGIYEQITINSGAAATLLNGTISINVGAKNPNPIVNNGTDTHLLGCLYDLAAGGDNCYLGETAWVNLGLVNSWANCGGPNATAQYMKEMNGWVEVRGCVSGGSSGSVIATLPEGFRPARFEAFPVGTDSGYGLLTVGTDGSISHNTGGTKSFYIAVRFRVN